MPPLASCSSVQPRARAGCSSENPRRTDSSAGSDGGPKLGQPWYPSSQLGKPIVGDSKGALFRRREMVDPQHRHLSKPEEFRGFDPAVAGNNLVFLVDHDRND